MPGSPDGGRLTSILARTGRWRSTYTLSSPTASQIDGQVNVLIHYFEEGNVQLNSSKSEQLTIPSDSSEEARSKAIVKVIDGFESKYQEELFNTCNELSDGAFRTLRRQLPMTKQKMDWDRVSADSDLDR
jgi:capping protein alpha